MHTALAKGVVLNSHSIFSHAVPGISPKAMKYSTAN